MIVIKVKWLNAVTEVSLSNKELIQRINEMPDYDRAEILAGIDCERIKDAKKCLAAYLRQAVSNKSSKLELVIIRAFLKDTLDKIEQHIKKYKNM